MLNYDITQHPIRSSKEVSLKEQLPIDAVDKLADELVAEYQNDDFRRWYCGVIYDFGFSKVIEWRKRAAEGSEPAKLFSKYVRDARTYKNTSTRNVQEKAAES